MASPSSAGVPLAPVYCTCMRRGDRRELGIVTVRGNGEARDVLELRGEGDDGMGEDRYGFGVEAHGHLGHTFSCWS